MSKIYYFDHASTTPVDRRVVSAMMPFFSDNFGNPSNLYSVGHDAKKALEMSVVAVARAINAHSQELVFTASATEADNLALIGVARANRHLGKRIIVSNIEHKGILETSRALVSEKLAGEGFEIKVINIKKNGLVDPNELSSLIDKQTILVSITVADSETGTIQPIRRLSRVISEFRRKSGTKTPYFHTDASQAANYLDLNVNRLGIDLMTLSSPKIYGPKGVGCLYVRSGTVIKPIIYGGGQQGQIRSGTENIPGIVGFARAMGLVVQERKKEISRIKRLRDCLEKGILEKIDKVVVNGNKSSRLPNFLNVSILDVEGEAVLLYLDQRGIIVNTGSACNSQTLEPSYVLTAFGRPYEHIHGSLRFTLGRKTTLAEVNYVIRNLPPIVERLRRISPLDLKIDQTGLISNPKAFLGGQTPHFVKKNEKNKK